MKDPELYDFFKKGSEAFDEMPPAALWDKINAGLKEGKKVKPTQSLLIKALIFLAITALITWIFFEFIEKELPVMIETQNSQPLKENEIHTTDTLIHYDSLKELPIQNPVIEKTITVKRVTATELKEGESTDEFDYDEAPSAKPEEPVFKVQATTQPTEEVATTTAYKNRIVVRTTKKLTDAAYELLVQTAIEKNKDNYGIMLIIIAPGHATYRKMIPGEKINAAKTILNKKIKTEIVDTFSIKPRIVTFTNTNYLSKVLLTEKDAEESAAYPGGTQQFFSYISKNFRIPEEADLNGKIIVSFSIETDGTLSDFKVIKDVGYGTGTEAIRVMKNCPTKWKPAYKDGKAVKTTCTLPIMVTTQ